MGFEHRSILAPHDKARDEVIFGRRPQCLDQSIQGGSVIIVVRIQNLDIPSRCNLERGTNENRNGIIRKVLPKGTAFADITEE